MPSAELRTWSLLTAITGEQRAIFQSGPFAKTYVRQGRRTSEAFGDATMKDRNLAMMSVDELWTLHEKTRAILSTKLDAEKHELERRLAQLNVRIQCKEKARRPYPKV